MTLILILLFAFQPAQQQTRPPAVKEPTLKVPATDPNVKISRPEDNPSIPMNWMTFTQADIMSLPEGYEVKVLHGKGGGGTPFFIYFSPSDSLVNKKPELKDMSISFTHAYIDGQNISLSRDLAYKWQNVKTISSARLTISADNPPMGNEDTMPYIKKSVGKLFADKKKNEEYKGILLKNAKRTKSTKVI